MVSRRLTLNLGLRYEYNTPDVEKQNRLAHLNIETMEYELATKWSIPGFIPAGQEQFWTKVWFRIQTRCHRPNGDPGRIRNLLRSGDHW